jgi:hypothetical protein
MIESTFPAAFIVDCIESDCDIGQVIRETRRHITLRQTEEQRRELASRADYYATGGADMAPLWMKRSAALVLARLKESGNG